MADFYDILSSQFTVKTPAGAEEIQVSGTEKVKLQAIADLFKAMQANLTGYTTQTRGGMDISSADSILSALTKLVFASGKGIVRVVYVNNAIVIAVYEKDVDWFRSISINCNTYIMFITSKSVKYSDIISWSDTQVGIFAMTGKHIDLTKTGIELSSPLAGYTDLPKLTSPNLRIKPEDTLLQSIQKLEYKLGGKNYGKTTILTHTGFMGTLILEAFNSAGGAEPPLGYLAKLITNDGRVIWYDPIGNVSILDNLSDSDSIIEYFANNVTVIYKLDSRDIPIPVTFENFTVTTKTIQGNYNYTYTGTGKIINLTPSFSLSDPKGFTIETPMSILKVPYDVKVNFNTVTGATIHLHQGIADLNPTSGFKIYTMMHNLELKDSSRHLYINAAAYN